MITSIRMIRRHSHGSRASGVLRGWRCLLPVFAILSGWPLSGMAANDILVLQSHDSAPYQKTLAGFKASLDKLGVNASYTEQILRGSADSIPSSTEPFSLILALGTPSAQACLKWPSRPPLLMALTLDAEELSRQGRASGVGLNFSASQQWEWLRRLLPDARRIVVFYDPQRGTALFDALKQQAVADDIDLKPVPASSPEDLPALLQGLPSQIDALWAVDGAAAFNQAAVRELLLYSFRNRTPLIGLSEQWVKAGALYALDWDYADLGAQAAELAADILRSNPNTDLPPPRSPRKVRPVINSKTLEHMKLTIPERWLPELEEVSP